MKNLGDLQTAYLAPCRHCAELMQAWELFCPFCGRDQTAAEAEALAHISALSAGLAQQETWIPPKEEFDLGVGLVRPGAIWPKEMPAGGEATPMASSSFATARRLLMGAAGVLLAVLVLALVHAHFPVDGRSQASMVPVSSANVGNATLSASKTIALSGPAAPTPAREINGVDRDERTCNEALAALALCSMR